MSETTTPTQLEMIMARITQAKKTPGRDGIIIHKSESELIPTDETHNALTDAGYSLTQHGDNLFIRWTPDNAKPKKNN